MPSRSDRLRWEGWALANLTALDHEPPEDWPEEHRQPLTCDPLFHGDHATGLAPVYAAANAIRAADQLATPAEVQELVRAGWTWVAARQQMRPDRTLRGGQWPRLIDAMCRSHFRRTKRVIAMDTPLREARVGYRQFDGVVERYLVAGRVVLLMLAGANYTVLRGFTQHNWLLFDSGGRWWVRRQRRSGKPLAPVPSSLVTLILQS